MALKVPILMDIYVNVVVLKLPTMMNISECQYCGAKAPYNDKCLNVIGKCLGGF